MVLDNLSTHTTPDIQAWLEANPRVQFHTDQPELLDAGPLLPTSRHDYDFDTLYDVLFEDDDHIGYLHHSDEPDAPGTLDYVFDPFRSDHDRDPARGFRR